MTVTDTDLDRADQGFGPVDVLSDVIRGAMNADTVGVGLVAATLDDDEIGPLIVLLAHTAAAALVALRGRDGAHDLLDRLTAAVHR